MDRSFNIRPETRASILHFLYRQLFVSAPPVSRRDVSLDGRRAIVTGSNIGLGLETARQLLDLGAKVILAVRDESKGLDARKQLSDSRHFSDDSIEVWQLDLSSYDSISKFVDRAKELPFLDIVILNAGLYNVHESFSSAGYEEDIQVNYLSNMLLTVLLLPALKKRANEPGRIVLVSSDQAAWAKFDERRSEPLLPTFKRKMTDWDMGERYGTSKLLGLLFVTELARHVPSSTATVVCANPGFSYGSSLARQARGLQRIAYACLFRLLGRKCSIGARTIVHAAAVLGVEAHGQYVEDAKVQPMPPLLYRPEGLQLARLLYEETLSETAFVGARDIIARL